MRQYGQYSSAPYVTVNPVGGIGAQVVRAHNAIEKKVWVSHVIFEKLTSENASSGTPTKWSNTNPVPNILNITTCMF